MKNNVYSIPMWHRRLQQSDLERGNVCLLGIPFDGAASLGKGAALAPEVIRSLARGIPPATAGGQVLDQIRLYDHGDVEIDLDWKASFQRVEDEAYTLLDTEKFCLFLGGDHSVTIPLHAAFGRKYGDQKIGIIHFDSHPDISDDFEGSKWSHACTERRAIDSIISPSDLAFVGLRGWAERELAYMDQHPEIMVITAEDVFEKGYKNACAALESKFAKYDALYLTLDIDVLDPAFAPGTGTPEAGGLTSRELMAMLRFLLSALPIKAMDIVEVSPPLDNENNITSWAAIKLIFEAFGELNQKFAGKS